MYQAQMEVNEEVYMQKISHISYIYDKFGNKTTAACSLNHKLLAISKKDIMRIKPDTSLVGPSL